MAYHVFISYRRQGASEMALLLHRRLLTDGYKPFLDMDGMHSGMFNAQIFSRIDECSSVVVILPSNAFNRSEFEEDWLRQEIAYALQKGKTIIPVVLPGFVWPAVLPDDINSLRFCQGVEMNAEYFDAVYEKICRLITYKPLRKNKGLLLGAALAALAAACAGVFLLLPIGNTTQPAITAAPTAASTPVITAAPTATPTATPTAAPTATPKPAPKACTIKQTGEGLMVYLPTMPYQDISTVELYRRSETGADVLLSVMSYPLEISYLDKGLIADERCSYYFRITATDGSRYPDSAVATESWTGYSQLSRLTMQLDSVDQRKLHIRWQDTAADLRYRVDVVCIQSADDANKQDRQVYYPVTSAVIKGMSYIFPDALPYTTYRVTVTELISGKSATGSYAVPKAEAYDEYNAHCSGAKLVWISQSELDSGKTPHNARSQQYSQLSVSAFAQKAQTHDFYAMSRFTYRKATPAHDFTVLYVLRGPDGHDVYVQEQGALPASSRSSQEYTWSSPITRLIRKMTGTDALTTPGRYLYEVYFDNERVSRTAFEIKVR